MYQIEAKMKIVYTLLYKYLQIVNSYTESTFRV